MKNLRRLLIIFLIIWAASTLLPSFASQPALEVWMLNVGQGESVLVREPSGLKLLFDGGPDDTVLSELGSVLQPWDKTLNLVILSHAHSDHLRGLIPVLNRYQVDAIWLPGPAATTADYQTFLTEAASHKPTVKFAGPATSFGQASLQIYHPLQSMAGTKPINQHDADLVVKVSWQEHSILLTGDLNEEHEQQMVDSCQSPTCSLHADVLQIPHHGSATGLLPAFLAAVQPHYALIPVGIGNSFGHPAPTALNRLKSARIPVFRTDLDGRIHVVISKVIVVQRE